MVCIKCWSVIEKEIVNVIWGIKEIFIREVVFEFI